MRDGRAYLDRQLVVCLRVKRRIAGVLEEERVFAPLRASLRIAVAAATLRLAFAAAAVRLAITAAAAVSATESAIEHIKRLCCSSQQRLPRRLLLLGLLH